jgi:uncharacterized protein (UPF0333 family)
MYADPYVADPYAVHHTAIAAPVPTYVPTYETGRSTKFKPLNCCALLAALTIFGVLIAAATVCWYHANEEFQASVASTTGTTSSTLNYTRSCFDLEGVATDTFVAGGQHVNTYTEYDSNSSLWSTFKLVQAFVLIGLILAGLLSIFLVVCFADSVRNRLLFAAGMNVLRIVLLFISALILASMVIAFLGFLGITNSFSDDTPACNKAYCSRFSDSIKEDRGTATVTSNGVTQTVAVTRMVDFGPDAGWFLVLACIPVAIILCILVVLNKFPIPVDSVGSGEAL